jgi:membrane associated rhomboid family serine protease
MIIPLGDRNRLRTVPFFNYLFLLANIGVTVYIFFLMPETAANAAFEDYALYPNRLEIPDLFTSMFLHASLLHLLGNMLFLWIFGDNIEDRFGHLWYVLFYFGAGVVAGLAHVWTIDEAGRGIATVGASGAISGVMGGYLILFPRAPILLWVFPWSIFAGRIPVPAVLAIGAWIAFQVYMVSGYQGERDSVAYWAHIGGFGFGAGVTLALRIAGAVTPGDYLARPKEPA